MPVKDIIHVAIRTMDLAATNDFYTKVLGFKFAPRPEMAVPGSWLDINGTQIHVLAGEKAFGIHDAAATDTGTVDHIAMEATGYDEIKASVVDHGCEHRENDIPGAGLWQLFIKDPNGVIIELNFRSAKEPKGSAGPDLTNQYFFGSF